MQLKDFFNTVDYKISEGSDFGWPCYGPNAYTLTAWNGDQDGWGANVTFDTTTQLVYEVDICDYRRQRAYRYFNPVYKDQYRSYANKHNKEHADQAWDNVNYVDLEAYQDWLNKAAAIVAGQDYDTRVSLPIDLDKDELYTLMYMAHEQDITLNQLVEKILWRMIKQHENKNSDEKAEI